MSQTSDAACRKWPGSNTESHTGQTSGSQMRWAQIIVDSETRVGGKEGER